MSRLFYLDGHNIAQWNNDGTFSQAVILNLCVEIRKRGDDYICFFDADVHYKISQQGQENIFLKLLKDDKRRYRVVPGGVQADGFIIMGADNDNASIISNDSFKHSIDQYLWLRRDASPQRLFKGRVDFSTIQGKDILMIPDLHINIPIETNIEALLKELTKYQYTSILQPKLGSVTVQKIKFDDSPANEDLNSQINIRAVQDIPRKIPQLLSNSTRTIVAIGTLLLAAFIIVKIFSNSRHVNYVPAKQEIKDSKQEISSNTQSVPIINECESQNTGECIFVNKMPRTVFIFLNDVLSSSTKIVVEPNQSVYKSDLPTKQYGYKYDYYESSNYYKGDVRGEISIQKCKSTTLELVLATAYWYTLLPNVWREIKIPADGSYTLVMPYKSFLIRFGDEEDIHVGNSFLSLADNIRKIYLKNEDDHDIEVSIQKDMPLESQ